MAQVMRDVIREFNYPRLHDEKGVSYFLSDSARGGYKNG
jgi:hypothetical protein